MHTLEYTHKMVKSETPGQKWGVNKDVERYGGCFTYIIWYVLCTLQQLSTAVLLDMYTRVYCATYFIIFLKLKIYSGAIICLVIEVVRLVSFATVTAFIPPSCAREKT